MRSFKVDYDPELEVYSYSDSLHVERKYVNDMYRADCFLALVTYHPPVRYIDSLTIANGTVNPMRMFDLKLDPMDLNEEVLQDHTPHTLIPTGIDTVYIPQPELQLRNSSGSERIQFVIGRSEIDYSIAGNQEIMDGIKQKLTDVQNNSDATLRSLSVTGYASPDGGLISNQRLADKRTKTLVDELEKSISEENRKYMKIEHSGAVEGWSTVADMAERDSLPAASKIREIVNKGKGNFAVIQSQLSRMPEYRSTIAKEYLPLLRRVEYNIDYTIFRELTDEEIRDKYKKDSTSLTRNEYYRLITAESDDTRREAMEANAIGVYPNFTWALNRYVSRGLQRGDTTSLELLKPLLNEDTPKPILYNQTIVALRNDDMTLADSLALRMKVDPETKYLIAVANAYSGHFDSAYEDIASQGGLNAVVIMLCLKRNQEAFKLLEKLIATPEYISDPRAYYVGAMCANRIEDLGAAMYFLAEALRLDPKLKKFAEVDSDVLSVYELIKEEPDEEN